MFLIRELASDTGKIIGKIYKLTIVTFFNMYLGTTLNLIRFDPQNWDYLANKNVTLIQFILIHSFEL